MELENLEKIKILELKTPRLLLKRHSKEHAEALTKLISSREFSDNTSTIPFPYTLENAQTWLEKQERSFLEGKDVVLGMFDVNSGELVGNIGLHLKNEHQIAEIGYVVGKPFWNSGYGTEAARALMQFGFSQLNLRKITARHYGHNPASGRIMQKLGMTKEGYLRQEIIRNERVCDVIVYGILREEWENTK